MYFFITWTVSLVTDLPPNVFIFSQNLPPYCYSAFSSEYFANRRLVEKLCRCPHNLALAGNRKGNSSLSGPRLKVER